MTDPTIPSSEDSRIADPPTSRPDRASGRMTPSSIVILSAWCGLVAGLLEVAVLVVRKSAFDSNRLYGMTRHFVWLIPLTDFGLLLGLGIALAVVVRLRPRRGAWLAARLLFAMTLLPAVMIAAPSIYGPAWLLLMLGLATRLVPALERHHVGLRWAVRLSVPVVAGFVPALAGWLWVSDRVREAGERARPMPPSGAPNILLVVLDTVAAGHLDLYGYGRPTSPTLDELARNGIRFDAARAASSWTLASHATMFTGRWPHELSVGWKTPLDRANPTLAQYLGSRGYATAGFVANTLYCATDSGLARGFTEYRDYIFPRLTALKPAVLVDRSAEGLLAIERYLANEWDIDISWSQVRRPWQEVNLNRKDAATVNREFFDWLSRRDQPDRPFFAFLNDYDAHWPYQLPDLSVHRFGAPPREAAESELILNWFSMDKHGLTPQQIALARDAYDDCVAHLDEQLGRLMDELGRRGLRERTWLIVLADHGESFGEHAGVFCHGTSLYRTELHVPLLIVPPTTQAGLAGLRVADTVSLRDLAATIVDLAGQETGSPFPGQSLARFWEQATPGRNPDPDPATATRALSEVVPEDPSNRDPSRAPEPQWPLAALSDGDWTYIRREGEIREELFHLPDDPLEARNRAVDPAAGPSLARMRQALGQLTIGPLTPQRFNP
jgi:arylsulfatase A-like enzyme